MNKTVFHKFELSPYPRKLWVVVTDDVNPINKKFYNRDNDAAKLQKEQIDGRAVTARVTDKKTGEYGFIVIFTEKEYLTIKTIAHEAFHVCDMLIEDVGMRYVYNTGNEHVAYLIGYIADCIESVKK